MQYSSLHNNEYHIGDMNRIEGTGKNTVELSFHRFQSGKKKEKQNKKQTNKQTNKHNNTNSNLCGKTPLYCAFLGWKNIATMQI